MTQDTKRDPRIHPRTARKAIHGSRSSRKRGVKAAKRRQG